MKKVRRFCELFLVLLCLQTFPAQAQDSAPDTLNKQRLLAIVIGGAVGYGATLIIMNELWYKGHPRTSFHWFNDNREWLQMDKGGHVVTSYYEGFIGYSTLRWAGVEERKAAIYGGGIGFILQTPIEILDGFSENWGASWGDLAANAAGSAIFISQQLAWGEQKAKLKYSFTPSPYAQYRPNVLGSNWAEQSIKDYNAITYWVTVPLREFVPQQKALPQWLCVSAGYGANGLIGGMANPDSINGVAIPHFPRYRQYYLSFDVDLSRIPTRHKGLRTALDILNIIKIPSPTLEYNSLHGVRGHVVYF